MSSWMFRQFDSSPREASCQNRGHGTVQEVLFTEHQFTELPPPPFSLPPPHTGRSIGAYFGLVLFLNETTRRLEVQTSNPFNYRTVVNTSQDFTQNANLLSKEYYKQCCPLPFYGIHFFLLTWRNCPHITVLQFKSQGLQEKPSAFSTAAGVPGLHGRSLQDPDQLSITPASVANKHSNFIKTKIPL